MKALKKVRKIKSEAVIRYKIVKSYIRKRIKTALMFVFYTMPATKALSQLFVFYVVPGAKAISWQGKVILL